MRLQLAFPTYIPPSPSDIVKTANQKISQFLVHALSFSSCQLQTVSSHIICCDSICSSKLVTFFKKPSQVPGQGFSIIVFPPHYLITLIIIYFGLYLCVYFLLVISPTRGPRCLRKITRFLFITVPLGFCFKRQRQCIICFCIRK